MLSRRLTLAAFAAVFAATSSLAMLQQGTRPASADQDDHWRRHAQHERHDRDDRRFHHGYYAGPAYNNPAYNNAVYTGNNGYWNNPSFNNAYSNDNAYWNGIPNYYASNNRNRRWNPKHNNGNHTGWYNGNGNRRHLDGRKAHVDPWRNHR